MNATSNTDNWYYNGEGKSEYGFDALADFNEAEKEKARLFVEKFNSEAPEGFVYQAPSEDWPFGLWVRENDEFGGTSVNLQPATGSDAVPDREYPDGLEMWVYAGEGLELPNMEPRWSDVDQEIRDLEGDSDV